jgi:hypothetical protein
MNRLSKDSTYKLTLQKLEGDFDRLMDNYLQKLHNAFHEDYGQKDSHTDIINKIKHDYMSIFSNKVGRITLDERSEDEVIKEILEYNFDMSDIKYMKQIEGIDLFSHLALLNENCVKRTDPEWFQFGIHELLQEGKVDLGPIGSRRTQFCKCCGERIYISHEPELPHQNNSIICSSDAKQKNVIDFEFSLPWDDVHRYMSSEFKADGTHAELWFNGRIQIQTGKVITASVGSITDNKQS